MGTEHATASAHDSSSTSKRVDGEVDAAHVVAGAQQRAAPVTPRAAVDGRVRRSRPTPRAPPHGSGISAGGRTSGSARCQASGRSGRRLASTAAVHVVLDADVEDRPRPGARLAPHGPGCCRARRRTRGSGCPRAPGPRRDPAAMVIWTSVTPGTWPRLVLAVHADERAGAGDRHHQHPRRPHGARWRPAAGPGRGRSRALRASVPWRTTSVREHSPPIVRAATSITDGPAVAHAHLGVDRAVDQPQGRGGGRGGRQHGGEVAGARRLTGSRRWSPRTPGRRAGRACRRRPGVEARPRRRGPRRRPRARARIARRAAGAPGSTPAAVAMRRTARDHGHGLVGGVGPQHSLAARQRGGLDHAREPDRARPRAATSSGPAPAAQGGEGGLGHLEGGQPGRAWRACRAPRRRRRGGCAAARARPMPRPPPGCPCRRRRSRRRGGRRSSWATMARAAVPGSSRGTSRARAPMSAAQGVGLLGADDHLDAQGTGGIEEVPGPVRRRGDEKE